MESLSRQGIDAIVESGNLLVHLEGHVVGSSHRNDVGKATIMHHVVATLGAALGDGPAIPCHGIVELRIDDEGSHVGTLGSTVHDGSLQQLLGKGSLGNKLSGIEQAILLYI